MGTKYRPCFSVLRNDSIDFVSALNSFCRGAVSQCNQLYGGTHIRTDTDTDVLRICTLA